MENIIDHLKEQEKINISTWKKLTKYKGVCNICSEEFEFEAIPVDKWDKPRKHFCSVECNNAYKERLYQERLVILPLKFRDIECDKLDLVKQGTDQSMFITGNVGAGKTVLMAGIVKEILKDSKNKVNWISYPGFIMELQSLYKSKDDSITPFERAEDIANFEGTLAIDDLGAEKMTAFVQQVTYYIINNREQEMLHTLITSNFSLQEINNQIDIRVSSRIAGMCKIIKILSPDRRLIKEVNNVKG